MGRPLGRLEDPPITEVVCGAFFKPVQGLDPVALGSFWKERQQQFPRREFKQPITAPLPLGFELNLGPNLGPLRTWLISKDDIFILQVQRDRFYLNWRARQAEYLRFNDWDGQEGILSRFMRQYRDFARFCSTELGSQLELQGIELVKIDHLEQGRHWKDSRDLASVLPMLATALALGGEEPNVALHLSTPRDDGTVDLAIDTMLRLSHPAGPVMKIEFRRTSQQAMSVDELEARFKAASAELNHLFTQLIPESQHHRFSKGWHA